MCKGYKKWFVNYNLFRELFGLEEFGLHCFHVVTCSWATSSQLVEYIHILALSNNPAIIFSFAHRKNTICGIKLDSSNEML